MRHIDYLLADWIVGDKRRKASLRRAKQIHQWCKKNQQYVRRKYGK